MSSVTGPWQQHRAIAETMAARIVETLEHDTGASFQIGNPASFHPEQMLGSRAVPMRAYVVDVHAPLCDVVVFVASLGAEHIEPLIAPTMHGVLEAAGVSVGDEPAERYTVRDMVELVDRRMVLEQTDALYLEGAYELSMPLGDVRIIFGTELLERAARLAAGEATTAATGGEFGDASAREPEALRMGAVSDPAARYEFGDCAIGDSDRDDELVMGAAGARREHDADSSALDALDRELAEAQRAAALHASAHDAAAHAASTGSDLHATMHNGAERWASLLSGVEVEVSAELGRTDLPLGDIASLMADRVLTLDQQVDEPVTVYVNGTAYATARLVIVDGEYGIEILELLVQQPDAASLLQRAA